MRSTLTFILNSLLNSTRESVRIAAKMLLKAYPLLAIPIFLATSVASIVLNDSMWNFATEGVQFVGSAGASAKNGFGSIYGKMNYLFPLSESIMMLATLVPIKIACVYIRIVKSFVPTIS